MMKEVLNFAAYSKYYDLLYEDKDYQREANYVHHLLQMHGVRGSELLELGSGTGKHANVLVDLGYRIHGLEISAEMVAKTTIRPGLTIQQGDICKMQLGRTFDAVVSLFHVVSYQTKNDAVTELFQQTHDHLNKGGLFVFDVWYSPAVYEQKPTVRVKRVANSAIEIIRIAEPTTIHSENRVDVKYTVFAQDMVTKVIQTFSELHSLRHFSIPEIAMLARMNGFELLEAKEFLSAEEPSEKTWGVCFVLRKVTM